MAGRKSGEIVLWSGAEEQGEPDPDSRDLIPIAPVPSHEAYADMEDFIARVRDRRPQSVTSPAS